MTGRPTNAASRSGIKSHVTKWMNVIKDYENVRVDLTNRNIILGAEQNLRSNYNKFAKLSNNVSRDSETANASQEEFDREQELQNGRRLKCDHGHRKKDNRSIRKATIRRKGRGKREKTGTE